MCVVVGVDISACISAFASKVQIFLQSFAENVMSRLSSFVPCAKPPCNMVSWFLCVVADVIDDAFLAQRHSVFLLCGEVVGTGM